MDSLAIIGNNYLQGTTIVNDGGILKVILPNVQYDGNGFNTKGLSNISLWLQYVKDYVQTSRPYPAKVNGTYNYSQTIYKDNSGNVSSYAAAIVWLLFTLALLIFAIFCLVYQHKMRKIKDSKILQFFIGRSIPRKSNRLHEKHREIFFGILTLVIVLFAIFLILLCLSQLTLNSKMTSQYSNSSNSSSTSKMSITSGIQQVFQYYSNMMNVLTVVTNNFINASVSNLSVDVTNLINSTIRQFGSDVLQNFGIKAIFDNGNSLVSSINNVQTSMININNTYKTVTGNINQVKGMISAYNGFLQLSLSGLCKKVSNYASLSQNCLQLQSLNQQFQTTINTGNIQSDSSIIMIFILGQYSINVTAMTSAFNTISTNFAAQLNQIFNDVVNNINVASFFNQISSSWSSVTNIIPPSVLSASNYSSTATTFVNSAAYYENIIVWLIIAVIFVMVVIILILSFIRIRKDIESKPSRCSVVISVEIVLTIFSFVFAVFAVIGLFASNFIFTEFCGSFNTTEGIQLSDQLINQWLTLTWPSFLQALTSSFTGVTLNFVQPTDILSGFINSCRNSSNGLLSAIGMGNLINVSAIIYSPQITNVVASSQNTSLNAFLAVNPSQILPRDMVGFLNQTMQLIGYFDTIDYQPSLIELQKPLFGNLNFTNFMYSLQSFILNVQPIVGSNDNDLSMLSVTYSNINQQIQSFQTVQIQTTNLLQQFLNLQSNRNNSLLIRTFLASVTSLQNILSNSTAVRSLFGSMYTQQVQIGLMLNAAAMLTTRVAQITSTMIPCDNISSMMETVTTMVCVNNQLVSAVATLFIILVIVTVLFQILTFLMILFFQLRVSFAENVSNC